MRVLQLCSKPPLPEIDGGCKAMNNITQGLLSNGVDVKVLCMSTFKHPFNKEKLSETYIKKTQIESVFIDTKTKLFDIFFNLFTSKSYNIERFISPEFRDLIIKQLKENKFDVIFLEGLYVTPYLDGIKTFFSGKIVYRAHNIEHEIWKRNATQEKNKFKKWYLNLAGRRLKKYEKSILNQIDKVAAITQKDKLELIRMGCKKRIEVFPFGIDMKKYKGLKSSKKANFFHIGSMDWMPNQEGIRWFLDHVWSRISIEFPEAQLNLAGKGMPIWMLNRKQKNVIISGQVEDAIQFINENDIMVVPLFSGSGMRIKVIEGMALGKAIIATAIAAEGINYEQNKNILIANSVEEYLDQIKHCISDQSFSDSIGLEAKKMIKTDYDNQLIVDNLVEFLKQ